jgi:hypothetical protein
VRELYERSMCWSEVSELREEESEQKRELK